MADEVDRCRVVDVGGRSVRVRGAAPLSDQGREALAEVIAAAERYLDEQAER